MMHLTTRKSVWILITLAILWRLLFFAVSVNTINVSGDESIMALQAIGITLPADSELFQTRQHPPGFLGRFPLLFMAQPYLFPVESYICAPFIRLLPHSAFGLRLIPALMGLIACLSGLFYLRKYIFSSSKSGIITTGLLVAIPSAYVLLLQAVYALPSYPAFMMLSMLAILCAEQNRNTSWKNPFFALIAGLLGGLVTSNTLIAAPFLAALAVVVMIGPNWKKALTGAPAFALGAAAGLAPFFIAKKLYPGAHQAVSALVDIPTALTRLWNPALNFTLPSALGINSTIMPDAVEMTGPVPTGLLPLFTLLWLLFMLCVASLCIYRFFQRLRTQYWPEIRTWDIMTGLSILYLLLFVLSTRFGSHEFRYLLPVAFFFPLLFGWLYAQSHRLIRHGLTVCAMLLIAINILTSTSLIKTWTASDFTGYFTDTRPAIEWMKTNNITHCYSSYFDVYSINYLSGEQIICAQPYNERFFGWPYPYADLVDPATNVAFVLGPGTRFRKEDLEYDLQHNDIAYATATAGKCTIYSNFQPAQPSDATPIPADQLTVTVSHHPEDAHTLSDTILTHQWRSHAPQTPGMWIQLTLPAPQTIENIKCYYNGYPHDHAESINILARQNNKWIPVQTNIPWELQPFDLINNHPAYSYQVQTIPIPPTTTDAIRLEINTPQPNRDWTIGEIQLFAQPY